MNDGDSLESPRGAQTSLRRVVLGTVGARILNVVLGGLTGVVIARVLAPEGRGAYAVVVTTATLAVAIGHLSVEQAHLAMWKVTEQRRALAANAIALAAVVGTAAALIAYGVVHLLGPTRVPIYSNLGLALALAGAPIAILVLYLNNLVALSARVDRLNRGLVLSATAQTAALLGLAAVGRLTVTAVVAVWLASTALPLLLTVPVLRPRFSDASAAVLKAEVTRGLRYHVGGALLFLLFRVDVFIVNAYRTQADVGLYALAVTIAELVYLLSDSIGQAVTARQASGDRADSLAVTTLAFRVTVVGSGLLVILLALVAPIILPLVYGEAFRGSVPAFLLLLPGVLALAVGRPIAGLLATMDVPGRVAVAVVCAFGVNITAAWLLIPDHGIVGAAAASSIGYLVLCLGYLGTAHHLTRWHWGELVPRPQELVRLIRRN